MKLSDMCKISDCYQMLNMYEENTRKNVIYHNVNILLLLTFLEHHVSGTNLFIGVYLTTITYTLNHREVKKCIMVNL